MAPATMSNSNANCRIERASAGPTLEFASFSWPAHGIGDTDWPHAPGAVLHDAAQRPELLHFAPGRWLAPEPTPAMRSRLDAAAGAGAGAVIDVSGKWDALLISGPGAVRLLACAVAIEAVLEGRDCATVTLFDCPAIVARARSGFALWVQSSYCVDFIATAERFSAALAIEP